MTLAVTHTFTANTLAQASQVNQNFTDLVAAIGAQTFSGRATSWFSDDESTTVSLQAIADALTDFDPSSKYWNKVVIGECSALMTSANAASNSCAYMQLSANGDLYLISRDGQVQMTSAGAVAQATSVDNPIGHIKGFDYTHTGNNRIALNGGSIEIDGSIFNLSANTLNLCLSTALTSALGIEKYYGVFVDPPASGSNINTADFEVREIAGSDIPTWSGAKASWRHQSNTDWRWMAIVRTNSTSAVLSCRRTGNQLTFMEPLSILSTTSPPQSMTALAADVPSVSAYFNVIIQAGAIKSGAAPRIFIVGGDDTNDISSAALYARALVATQPANGAYTGGEATVITSLAGKIKYAISIAGASCWFYNRGFELPGGM